jgi:hypothetical protein
MYIPRLLLVGRFSSWNALQCLSTPTRLLAAFYGNVDPAILDTTPDNCSAWWAAATLDRVDSERSCNATTLGRLHAHDAGHFPSS